MSCQYCGLEFAPGLCRCLDDITDTERREAMRQDVLAMAERADNAIEFHLNFQVTFVPRDQWSTGHYEERRDEFRDHASRCRAFAEALGR